MELRIQDERYERADRETIRGLQFEKLQALLAKAWETNPFYRDHWQAAGVTPDDITSLEAYTAKLPHIRKRDPGDDAAEPLLALRLRAQRRAGRRVRRARARLRLSRLAGRLRSGRVRTARPRGADHRFGAPALLLRRLHLEGARGTDARGPGPGGRDRARAVFPGSEMAGARLEVALPGDPGGLAGDRAARRHPGRAGPRALGRGGAPGRLDRALQPGHGARGRRRRRAPCPGCTWAAP